MTPTEIRKLRELCENEPDSGWNDFMVSAALVFRVKVPALLDEVERLQKLHLHGCDCSPDDACLFARERDAVLREVERLRAIKDALIQIVTGMNCSTMGVQYTQTNNPLTRAIKILRGETP